VFTEDTDIKIANINFAQDNAELLKMLALRGSLIVAGKYTKLNQVNQQIRDYMILKRNEVIRPVKAFITFETQEGYERALKNYPRTVPPNSIPTND
jgi:hypothetical protein